MSARVATNEKSKSFFGLFGLGGFAREVMPLVFERHLASIASSPIPYDTVAFVEKDPTSSFANGIAVMREEDFLAVENSKYFNVAIADSRIRERLVAKCEASSAKPVSIFSGRSVIYESATIGEGAVVCANAVISANTAVGRHFHLNFGSYVAHDCIVGDFVTFAPAVQCCGNVIIGDHVFVGVGALIHPGTPDRPLRIGSGAVIGMGAVVIDDVDPGATVVGNPARPIHR